MPAWLRHCLAWTAMFAFALSAKVHLPFVQMAAWTVMAANYAEMMPVDQAMHRAVSGDELCGGCLYVRNADNARQTGEAMLAKSMAAGEVLAVTPEFEPVAIAAPVRAGPGFPYPEGEYGESFAGVPETPPPRA